MEVYGSLTFSILTDIFTFFSLIFVLLYIIICNLFLFPGFFKLLFIPLPDFNHPSAAAESDTGFFLLLKNKILSGYLGFFGFVLFFKLKHKKSYEV